MRGNDGNSDRQAQPQRLRSLSSFQLFRLFLFLLLPFSLPPLNFQLVCFLCAAHKSFYRSIFLLKHGTLSLALAVVLYRLGVQKSPCILKSIEIYTEISVIHSALSMPCIASTALHTFCSPSFSHHSVSLCVFRKV